MKFLLFIVLLVVFDAVKGFTHNLRSNLINLIDAGMVPDVGEGDLAIMTNNQQVLNTTLNSLLPGDTLVIPEGHVYHLIGGIVVPGHMTGVTVVLNGELKFDDNRDTWPTDASGHVLECLDFHYLEDVVFTSTLGYGREGVLNGNGRKWWGAIKFLIDGENRPRLIHVRGGKNIIWERILLKDSPYWSFYFEKMDGLIVRYASVDARITDLPTHTPLDLTAFNTDGFDVTGNNVHIHDVNIWNQDDCVCVKDGSTNMLIERVNASGLGLVVGSIGSSVVRNITFRDSIMIRSFKGIYMKTRWNDGPPADMDVASISDVTYENITMIDPEQYGIWIGPAQQTGQPCDLTWPQGPHSTCPITGYQTWKNILLKDITIIRPRHNAGVLISNSTNPMQNVVFDNVVVTHPGDKPFGLDGNYYCDSMDIKQVGLVVPSPIC
jgi:hypothetical protein